MSLPLNINNQSELKTLLAMSYNAWPLEPDTDSSRWANNVLDVLWLDQGMNVDPLFHYTHMKHSDHVRSLVYPHLKAGLGFF